MSKKNTTRFVPNPKKLPALPKGALRKLDAMGDSAIDYSDIPAFTEAFWKNAKILRPTRKKMLSLRVDEPVLGWFRKQGKGYQGYMNAVLRAYVESRPNA